jgi:thiamine-phosphate pyrophosphorylase
VHSVEEAEAAARAGADYVTFGHVFQTESKPGLPPQGVVALRRVVAAAPVPVLAIGGITPDNAAPLLETGCAGVAVIRAVLGAEDPGVAVAALRQAMAASRAAPRRPFPGMGGRGHA